MKPDDARAGTRREQPLGFHRSVERAIGHALERPAREVRGLGTDGLGEPVFGDQPISFDSSMIVPLDTIGVDDPSLSVDDESLCAPDDSSAAAIALQLPRDPVATLETCESLDPCRLPRFRRWFDGYRLGNNRRLSPILGQHDRSRTRASCETKQGNEHNGTGRVHWLLSFLLLRGWALDLRHRAVALRAPSDVRLRLFLSTVSIIRQQGYLALPHLLQHRLAE